MTIVFDKLAAVRRLEQAEFSRPQAEAMTDVFHDAVHGAVATKADLEEMRAENRGFAASTTAEFAAVRSEMKAEFAAVRAEMKSEFATVRAEMKTEFATVRAEIGTVRSEMREQRSELKLWTAGAAVAVVGALGTVMSLLLRARGIG